MPRLLLIITLLLLGSVPAHAVETAAPVTWLDVTQSAATQDEETPSLTGWIDPTG